MPSDLSLHLNPLLPGYLVAAVGVLLLVAVAWSLRVLRGKRVPRRSVFVLGGLRVAAVAILLVGLLQPIVGFTRTTRPKPELVVVVDTSRSMGLPDGDRTRLERGVAALRDGAIADHLRQHFAIRYYSGGASATEVKELGTLEANGDTTRLADSLRSATELARADGTVPRRVLLVSDGADHGTEDPASVAASLGVPIDVLSVGTAASANPALTLAEVQAASRVLLGSETRFLAVVRGEANTGARTVTVQLAENGKDVQSVPVTVPAGRAVAWAELSHRPETAGLKRYTLRIAGADMSGEYPVNVQVVDRTHEVLILEDTWRWEFKYLRRAVEEDPSFRFTAILARGPATVMQFGSPDRRAPLVGLPQNADDIAPFDIFMLGDVNPTRWPRGLAAEIARGVKDEGKSLVVVAGPNLAKIAEQPELHALLPVVLGEKSGDPTEGDIAVRATDDTAARFFFEPGQKSALPPLERVYAPIRKRPAARVLLETSKLANEYGPLIVMAEQTVGRGRVLFIGTDALWQWQTLSPPDGSVTPHKAYWQRALRALAPARPTGDGGVWLLPDRTRVEAGQPLTVWAETRGPATAGTITANAVLPDDRQTALAAAADPTRPGRWRFTFTPPKPGTYRLSAAVRLEGQPAGEAATVVEVIPGGETTDAAPDHDTLGRIAQASGGRVLNPSDAETWPTESPVPVARRHTVELWGDGLLLLLITAVLGLDWLLRLLRGYV